MIEELAARQRAEALAATKRRSQRQQDAAFWDGQGVSRSGGSIPATTGSNGPLRLGQSAPLMQGGGSVQVDTVSRSQIEAPINPVISGRVIVLAYTEKNGIYEIWIGGDRTSPLKIAEVPIAPIPTSSFESLRGWIEVLGQSKNAWRVSLQYGSTIRTIYGSGGENWQLTHPACPYVRYRGNGFWCGGPYNYRPYIHAQKSVISVVPHTPGFLVELNYAGFNQSLNDPNFPLIYGGENTATTTVQRNDQVTQAQIAAEIAAENPKFYRPNETTTTRQLSTQCWFFSLFKQPGIQPSIETISGTNEYTGDLGSLAINLNISPNLSKPYGFSYNRNSDSSWEYNRPLQNFSGVDAIAFTKTSYGGSAYFPDYSSTISTGYPQPLSAQTFRQFLTYNNQEFEILNDFLGDPGFTQWKIEPQNAYPIGYYTYPQTVFNALLQGSTKFVLQKYSAVLASNGLNYQVQNLPPEKVFAMKIGDNLIGLDCRFRS